MGWLRADPSLATQLNDEQAEIVYCWLSKIQIVDMDEVMRRRAQATHRPLNREMPTYYAEATPHGVNIMTRNDAGG
jgi:hypothetical protein